MKKFKDLQVGDTVFIGFEKKTITKIVPDKYYPEDGIVIYISKDDFYYVYGHLSVDYCYSPDYCYGPEEHIFTGKEAMIEHYEDKLRDLELDYKNKKSRYEKWLETAKKLE